MDSTKLQGMFLNETYATLMKKFGGKSALKLANNTYLRRMPSINIVCLQYHYIDVVRFYEGGEIVINNGGHRTVTTKERINAVLHGIAYVAQEKYQWYLYVKDVDSLNTYRKYAYENGMSIDTTNGTVSTQEILPTVKH